jgi:hypothetical protein
MAAYGENPMAAVTGTPLIGIGEQSSRGRLVHAPRPRIGRCPHSRPMILRTVDTYNSICVRPALCSLGKAGIARDHQLALCWLG